MTAFVDGDRGGDLIIKELSSVAELDHVTRAPDGKEVEEITKKEIHKAIRGKIAAEQAKFELEPKTETKQPERKPYRPAEKPAPRQTYRRARISDDQKAKFKEMLNDLIGTRGSYILDDKLNILGKVPVAELANTLKDMDKVYAVVMDGSVDRALADVAERKKVKHLVAKTVRAKSDQVDLVATASL